MSEAIDSLTSTTFAGKRFNRQQLVRIWRTVNDCRRLSLRELGHTLCEHLNWVTPGGKHRIQTCLKALEEMQSAGLFRLPAKQTRPDKATQKPIQWSSRTGRRRWRQITENLDGTVLSSGKRSWSVSTPVQRLGTGYRVAALAAKYSAV